MRERSPRQSCSYNGTDAASSRTVAGALVLSRRAGGQCEERRSKQNSFHHRFLPLRLLLNNNYTLADEHLDDQYKIKPVSFR
jgi:hypothetical protein